jgi:hypothetical protein
MTRQEGDGAGGERTLEDALEQAIAGLSGGGDAPGPDAVDGHWLGLGLRLGLERPDDARRLLGLLESRAAARAVTPGAGARADDAPADDAPAEDDGRSAPVVSLLLARSAALPPSEMAALGPGVVFGWAAELTAAQVLRIGAAVVEMMAEGASADIGRGLGLAWEGGARIPGPERDRLFREFTELEAAVAGVLTGRDLHTVEADDRRRGFGAFAQLFGTRSSGPSTVSAAIEAAGEPGRRGLVALWNTWMAMRYRSTIPDRTFELVVRPWVTVVGRLPDR